MNSNFDQSETGIVFKTFENKILNRRTKFTFAFSNSWDISLELVGLLNFLHIPYLHREILTIPKMSGK